MTYLAITQGTAEWLLPKTGVLDALYSSMGLLTDGESLLAKSEFLEGPVLVTRDTRSEVVALIHADYVSGTGEED
jgi:hypothetical protein